MTSTKIYIREWQQALQKEINYLKKYGGNRYTITNGRLVSNDVHYTYYFDTTSFLRVPIGATIRLEWGSMKSSGRVLSSEGKGLILELEKSFGDLVPEAVLLHDPWELLEHLIQRLDEIKKSKRKRLRIKNVMEPSMDARHPKDKIKSNVHELILRSKYNPVTFIWGPPGTGKTYTLARTAANKYFQDKRVLILAHSNQAVDVLIGEAAAFIEQKNRFREGDVLRYGGQPTEGVLFQNSITSKQLLEKQDPLLAADKERLWEERRMIKNDLSTSFSKRDSDELLEIETKLARVLEKIRQKETEFLNEAYIVGTTLAKAAMDSSVYEKEFDLVIVDEASMAYVPQAAFAANLGKRVIICGDFKQLPPIASGRDSLITKWLKEDIFHRARVVDWVKDGELHPHLFLLKEQRRMHPDISAFTNKYIYHSLVGDHESVKTSRNQIVKQKPFPGRASLLLDTSFSGKHCMSEKTSQSRYNLWQLLLSFQLIHESYLGGATSIGYMSPYRAQAGLMELLLNDLYKDEQNQADITAATVHKFQGSERDIMIFDSVDDAPQSRAGMLLTGKDSERLINVAITRTRGKFIHVASHHFIQNHVFRGKTLRQLADYQANHQQRVTTSDIGTWIQNQHSRLNWVHAKKLERIFTDIENARSSLIISLPQKKGLTREWKEKLLNRNKSVDLTILSSGTWEELQPSRSEEGSFPFPFVMIDNSILWLGLPLEGADQVLPPYVAARLNSRAISEYFLGQISLLEKI
ncbi:DEAD/DEAH box helicase [Mesobacillus foraminis]|uniref:DEAD/DEAH box helicase n=1 Tax=Mesobacillus foraminis TaxID=279826 RepID=UPI000EF5325E|nr:AAA domain-containing protein [Mesobacillus foraminis]